MEWFLKFSVAIPPFTVCSATIVRMGLAYYSPRGSQSPFSGSVVQHNVWSSYSVEDPGKSQSPFSGSVVQLQSEWALPTTALEGRNPLSAGLQCNILKKRRKRDLRSVAIPLSAGLQCNPPKNGGLQWVLKKILRKLFWRLLPSNLGNSGF